MVFFIFDSERNIRRHHLTHTHQARACVSFFFFFLLLSLIMLVFRFIDHAVSVHHELYGVLLIVNVIYAVALRRLFYAVLIVSSVVPQHIDLVLIHVLDVRRLDGCSMSLHCRVLLVATLMVLDYIL